MSKFTDSFFLFPIKIYDPYSQRRSMEFEEDVNVRTEGEWIGGQVRIPAEVLSTMTWQDGYSNGKPLDEVREEGFDLTIVYIDLYGEFICTWPRKKFEEKINEFMARQPKREEDLHL